MQTRFGADRRMLGGECATHVSWWEADAWCRWAARRLPAEVEWELAASTAQRRGFRWGDVWEWTASSYLPYPGYRAWAGAVGEYNGKFMINQMVLRGGSWFYKPQNLRSALRDRSTAVEAGSYLGFRLARTL